MQEKVFIENNKGLKIATLLNLPETDGPFPTLIILPGFTGYKEHVRFVALAEALLPLGIATVVFDPSGYGESDGTVENDYRFTNYVEDAQVIFDYVEKLDWVDKNNSAVLGESMGGVQAIVLAKNNQANVKALVLISSPIMMANDEDMKNKYKTWESDGFLQRKSSRYGEFRVPYEFAVDARKWDGMKYLEGLDLPLLVMWGTNDVNVPPHITKQLYDAAIGPKESVVLEGADHFMNRDPKMIEEMARNVANYLSRKLR